ncbi:MAG: hypothetical protein J7501_05765 [Bdellovibrio sp.]|nr:hypothetical protein [Bdellovibrio sp.]
MEKAKEYLPNAVAIDLASNNTMVNLTNRESISSANASVSNSEGLGKFASALSLSVAPSKNQGNGFGFKVGPELTFAFNNLRFKSDSALLDSTDFQLLRTSLGASPEVNYKTNLGTFYASLGLGLAYSWISWSSPASGDNISGFNLNFILSIGYYVYASENMLVKVYTRSITEDKNIWNKALDASQGFDVPVESVSNNIVGFSFAYVF